MTTVSKKPFVEALANGMSVLESFNKVGAELTVSEVARLTGLTPATARRSLYTLSQLGYLENFGKKFVISARVLTISSAYLRSTKIEELILPILRDFVAKFGDASSVTIYDKGSVLYICHYSEQRATRRIATFGTKYPAYATSTGKVLLSALDEDKLNKYLQETEFKAFTANTITTKKALISQIDSCKSLGYATSRDELDFGITSMAVPIRSPDGLTVASINTSAYSGHVNIDDLVKERLDCLRESSKQIWHVFESNPALLRSTGLYLA